MNSSLLYAIIATVAVVLQHQSLGVFAGGALFTRWGNDECPETSNLVYSGFAGGSCNSHNGGAAEYLCLPTNPTGWKESRQYESSGLVFGAVYELYKEGGGYFLHHNNRVPCAVCQSQKHRQHVLMLPARDFCPNDWFREYFGQLMSGHHDEQGPSQYVCVDKAMKSIKEISGSKENGKVFSPVKAQCGSLPCPPYKADMLLSCAVCSQ